MKHQGNLDDTPAQADFRRRVRDWHDRHATPRHRSRLFEVPMYMDEARAKESFEAGRTWQATLFEHGWAGLAWPSEYGGGGGEPWQTRIFAEVAAQYEESAGFLEASISMLGPTLLRHGTHEQKCRFVPGLLSAEMAFCQLFSEPGAGSDLASLGTRAVLDGNEFVVNGQKVWNSQAQFCDWGFMLVRSDPDAPKHRGITFLLLDMHSPGVQARPLVQMNGAAHFNEVFLSDVRVPVANVVGEINGGWGPARTVLMNESAFIGDRRGATVMPNLVELARRGGRLQDERLRQRLARIWSREQVQRWMGETIQQSVRRGEAPAIEPAVIKLFAAETRRLSGDLAAELGGMSMAAGGGDAAEWARFELTGRFLISIGGGTNEVMRNNIGERALGLPREPRPDHNVAWRDTAR